MIFAERFAMTLPTMTRRFKRYCGTSINAYLQQRRIEAAMVALRHSSDSVLSIALSCGFNDVSWFSRCFQRTIGVSATAYRKQFQEGMRDANATSVSHYNQAWCSGRVILFMMPDWIADRANGDIATMTQLQFCAHTGTHCDAPRHFIDGPGIETLDLETLIGPCYVADLQHCHRYVTAADLAALSLPFACRRLLLKTKNSVLWQNPCHQFQQDFIALSEDAADWIVEHGIELVGVDYLSVAPFADPEPVHVRLLSAGVIALEALDLRMINSGSYELICLPIKVLGSDGAPARGFARLILNTSSRP